MRITTAIFHLYSIVHTTLAANSTPLNPRKSTSLAHHDPYIVCDMDGPRHNEGLPLRYSDQVYADLLTLCSYAHGARQNVGCFCAYTGRFVHCDEQFADAELWNANYRPENAATARRLESAVGRWGEITFPDLCRYGCECRSPRDQAQYFREAYGDANYDALRGINGLMSPESTAGGGGEVGGGISGAGTLAGSVQGAGNEVQVQNQCGGNCTTAKDCVGPEGGAGACSCRGYSEQYQPGAGTVAFVAACLVMLGSGGGGGGKREEPLPCPCNSTYVSHGCCDVLDGVIWEPHSSNLGFLGDSWIDV